MNMEKIAMNMFEVKMVGLQAMVSEHSMIAGILSQEDYEKFHGILQESIKALVQGFINAGLASGELPKDIFEGAEVTTHVEKPEAPVKKPKPVRIDNNVFQFPGKN